MYKITICYQTITPESAEIGDFHETGIETEYTEKFFSDIFDHSTIHFNNWYLCDFLISDHTWLYTIPEITDYSTLEETEYTLHITREDEKPLSKRHWQYICHRFSIDFKRHYREQTA